MREVDRLNVRTSWRRPLRYLEEHAAKSGTCFIRCDIGFRRCLVCAAMATLAARGVPAGGMEPPFDPPAVLSLSPLDHARDDPERAEGPKDERLAQDRPIDSPLILSLSKDERLAQDRPRRDPAIETLAIDAAGVAPEFAADAMIRIASSPRVTD